MNITLFNPLDNDFFIASVRKEPGDIFNEYLVITKRVSSVGRLLSKGQDFKYSVELEAERKVRDIIKTKIKRRGWLAVDLGVLPAPVVKFLEVPTDMMVTSEELVMILRKAQVERYVVFGDTAGLEEYFDRGVEYLGYITDDDNTIKVFDKFGTLRECFINRFASIEPTERAIEAKTKDLRNAGDARVQEIIEEMRHHIGKVEV